MIASSIKAEVVKANARGATDTGSPEVQVALLTARINELTPHFKLNMPRITTAVAACCAWSAVAASCWTTSSPGMPTVIRCADHQTGTAQVIGKLNARRLS
jgi:hypothetical protein